MAKYKIYDFTAKAYEVTQDYGANIQLYKDLTKDAVTGKSTLINGHEGVDFGTPTGTEILAPFEGIIVRDEINQPGWKNYGVFTTIWDPVQNIALWFCHLKDFTTKIGDHVKRGDIIAHTNNTGNTTGEHCHVNFCETDNNGMRLNQDNGSLGFLNILDATLVQILPIPTPSPDPSLISQVAQGSAQEVNVQTKVPIPPSSDTKTIVLTLSIPLSDNPENYMGIRKDDFKTMHDKCDLYDPMNTAGYRAISDIDKMKQEMLDQIASIKSNSEEKLNQAEKQHEDDFKTIQALKGELLSTTNETIVSNQAYTDILKEKSAAIEHSLKLGEQAKLLEDNFKSVVEASGIPTIKTKSLHGIVTYFASLRDKAEASMKKSAQTPPVVKRGIGLMQALGLSVVAFVFVITAGFLMRR